MDTFTPIGQIKVKAGTVYTEGVELVGSFFIPTTAVIMNVNKSGMFKVNAYTKVGLTAGDTYSFSGITILILASA